MALEICGTGGIKWKRQVAHLWWWGQEAPYLEPVASWLRQNFKWTLVENWDHINRNINLQYFGGTRLCWIELISFALPSSLAADGSQTLNPGSSWDFWKELGSIIRTDFDIPFLAFQLELQRLGFPVVASKITMQLPYLLRTSKLWSGQVGHEMLGEEGFMWEGV